MMGTPFVLLFLLIISIAVQHTNRGYKGVGKARDGHTVEGYKAASN